MSIEDRKIELMYEYKRIRKFTRITQGDVAKKLNEVTGRSYGKGAISNYENDNLTLSLERTLQLVEAVGGEVLMLVKQPLSRRFLIQTAKMEKSDYDNLMQYIKEYHKNTVSTEIDIRLFINNYINKYIDVHPSKNGLTFLFLEKNKPAKYEYSIPKKSK